MTAGPYPAFVIPGTRLPGRVMFWRARRGGAPFLGLAGAGAGRAGSRSAISFKQKRAAASRSRLSNIRPSLGRIAESRASSSTAGVHHLQAAIGELHAKASAMVRVGQALDQPAPLQPVDLLGHCARGHEERLEEVGGTHGIGRPATAQREQHAHVPGAHAEARPGTCVRTRFR